MYSLKKSRSKINKKGEKISPFFILEVKKLFYRYRFCQISRLVNIAISHDCNMIGQ